MSESTTDAIGLKVLKRARTLDSLARAMLISKAREVNDSGWDFKDWLLVRFVEATVRAIQLISWHCATEL